MNTSWRIVPFIDTCSVVFCKKASDDAKGFDEELARGVDMDFSFRLLSSGYAFSWVPEIEALCSRLGVSCSGLAN